MLQTNNNLNILLVSPDDNDHTILCALLSDSPYKVRSARNCLEAWKALHEERVDIVITECEFPDGLSWKDLLGEVEALRGAQPVIAMSRFADGRLWAEVLNLGAYDLLMKPFDPSEVLRVIMMAGRQAAGTRQVRRHGRHRHAHTLSPVVQPALTVL